MFKVLCTIILMTPSLSAGVWPSGGTLPTPLRHNATVDVTWDQGLHAEYVNIELWDGERRTFLPIAASVPAANERYKWTIPSTLVSGSMYRLVVRDAQRPKRAEFSAGFHSIRSASDFATTVEDNTTSMDSLFVTPFPATDRARIAWTRTDAASIDIVDLQGAVVLRMEPAHSTRSCVVQTSALLSGTYSVLLKLVNGVTHRSWLVVAH